ncbi:MAG: hypothetical protein R6V36_09735 [Psychroflexus sp.]
MSDSTVYLAGPIAHSDTAASWREAVAQDLPAGVEARDPLARFDARPSEIPIVDGKVAPMADAVSVADIVETDKHLLAESDGVLVGFESVRSAGTPMEVMWAHEREMPIVVWVRDGTPIDTISPWYRYHADVLTDARDVALRALLRRLGGGSDE